jgi:flagellar P-ring protein FlgI
LIADIEVLEVTPDAIARVVINGRTGTLVIGDQVRIAPVAVAHGPLTIEVQESPAVSQPAPASGGTTTTVPASAVAAAERPDTLKVVAPGATLADVVRALNALGATPRDLVDILQAMRAAGALQADLEVL